MDSKKPANKATPSIVDMLAEDEGGGVEFDPPAARIVPKPADLKPDNSCKQPREERTEDE